MQVSHSVLLTPRFVDLDSGCAPESQPRFEGIVISYGVCSLFLLANTNVLSLLLDSTSCFIIPS